LRTVSDIPFDDLFVEDIAAEIVTRLRSSAPRSERVLCAALLFDEPPIILRRAIPE
jgi:hypothetical protein